MIRRFSLAERMLSIGFLVALVCSLSSAQTSPWSVRCETKWRSTVDRRILDAFTSSFDLSESQVAVAKAMFDQHAERFEEFVAQGKAIEAKFEEEFDKVNSGAERRALEVEREEALAPLADRQRRIDDEFIVSLKELLTPVQASEWEWFAMRVDRIRDLPHGELFHGEDVDLIEILDRMHLESNDVDDHTKYEQMRFSYARQMSKAISERRECLVEWARREARRSARLWRANNQPVYVYDEFGTVIRVEHRDQEWKEAMKRRWAERRQYHVAIRDLNRDYLALFASLLTREARTELRNRWEEWILDRPPQHGQIYAMRVLDSGLLNAEQVGSIQRLLEQHRDALDRNTRRWVRAGDASAELRFRLDAERAERIQNANRVLMIGNERIEMENKLVTHIAARLSGEQRTQLPPPDKWALTPLHEIE